MAYNKTDRADAPMKRRNIRRRKKVCEYCANKEANKINNAAMMTFFL